MLIFSKFTPDKINYETWLAPLLSHKQQAVDQLIVYHVHNWANAAFTPYKPSTQHFLLINTHQIYTDFN